MKEVKAIIPVGFGLNCEKETSKAFELAGAKVQQIFINNLVKNPKILLSADILCLIGGFSFGDHLGAGTVLANKFKAYMKNEIKEFIKNGKLIIGICNGFQVMTRLGLFAFSRPLFEQEFGLIRNDSKEFRNDWVFLKTNPRTPCVFTKKLDTIELPIRHGEGKFCFIDNKASQALQDFNGIVFQYACPKTSVVTSEFPANPNGSINSIAGICNTSGRIFGLMPHPEAYLSPLNHPDWLSQKNMNPLPQYGAGLKIFSNAVDFVKKKL